MYTFLFKKYFIYLFLGRGREGKREGDKYQCARDTLIGCLLPTPNWGCALTGNQTGDLSVHTPALNPLSHTSQGIINVHFSL